MKPIVFHPDAEAELDEAMAYYEDQRVGLGLRLKAEVENALALIQQQPQLRPRYKETNYRKSVLGQFPYTIFYFERDDSIWIAAVAHQKRRPGYWESRVPE